MNLRADNSIDVVSSDGRSLVSRIAAPWAFDANGRSVPTRYVVNGNTVTQVVDTAKTTKYPVVADPTFGREYWVIPTMYLNKSETKKVSNGGVAGVFCGGLPGGWAILCGANTARIVQEAGRAVEQRKCVRILLSPGVFIPEIYSGGNCK